MLQLILIILAVIIVLFVVVVASRPSTFQVSRSIRITAPPSAVFSQVNDLHNFQTWSPWTKLDPGCKTAFSGPVAGAGAVFAWSGNNKVGEGRMTLTESHPTDLIRFKLEFLRPFKGTNLTEFTFKPEGAQTAVTWTMSGQYNFITKAVGLFMNCDKMMGGKFDKGLAQMKSLTEAAVPQAV